VGLIIIIGAGNVGFAISDILQKKGHTIITGNNNLHSESLKKALERNPGFTLKPFQDAVNDSHVVFFAAPFQANETVSPS
jgi:predicted dinucleotide-binding enzyme